MVKSTALEGQIIGQIWVSPDVYANVGQLCDFGSRFSGTESERQARDFIHDRFRGYGLKNVRLVTFDYLSWGRGEASLRIVKPLQKELPLDLNNQVGTTSDHFPYFMRGVPVASMFARRPPGLGRGFGHTMADTLDKVSEVELRESAMVAARLLLRLADHQDAIGRKRTADEIKQILLDHDLEEPLKAQGKWPFG
jgi:hypothetical protein